MTPITIPQLDANIVDVTITEWRRHVGERVEKGGILAVLTTDKAAYEFESPGTGVLLAIVAPAKSIVPTGAVIGVIGEPGEEAAAALSARQSLAVAPAGLAAGEAGPVSAQPAKPRVRATPRARRLATEKGFDLAAIGAAVGVEIIDEAAVAAYEQQQGGKR